MSKLFKKLLSVFIVVSLSITSFTVNVYSQETDESYVTEGTYSYTSNENSNIQDDDEFSFREDCFMRSSFIGCYHLYELSASAAIASASRYGDSEDRYEIDPSNNAQNIKQLLTDMGFENVKTNKYYTLEKLENSAAVAVGSMKIEAFGKSYTLLAIIPRSAGYKREWVGNFTVGDGDVHEGFKAGRDEILRFVKQYIEENNITGNLKVWTTGHSRGSALANLVGGFFAGGGIEYFGDNVSISPEDVYCYTFADPTVIKDGASKVEELSVQGYRGGVYENDTPKEAFTYTGSGSVNVKDSIYGGIRNYPLSYDLITMLPPESWGFTLYGEIVNPDKAGNVSTDEMLQELQELNTYAYNASVGKGDYRNFEWKTFDLNELKIVEDESMSGGSLEQFMKQRMNSLTYFAKTNQDYVDNNTQKCLQAVAGIYGLLLPLVYAGEEIKTDGIIQPLMLTYLAYASQRIMLEKEEIDEDEAVLIAIEDLLSFVIGEEIEHNSLTIDKLIFKLFGYIMFEEVDGELVEKNSVLSNTIIKKMVEAIDGNEKIKPFAIYLLQSFVKNYDAETTTLTELITAYMSACIKGPEEGTSAYDEGVDAKSCRGLLASILSMALMDTPYTNTKSAITSLDSPLSTLVSALLKDLKSIYDENNEYKDSYKNLQDAADANLKDLIDSILDPLIDKTESIYNKDYHDALVDYKETIKEEITLTRNIITYLLFYTENKTYSTESIVRNASTFISSTSMIPPAHYNENYISWARALRKIGGECCEHYIEHIEEVDSTCSEEGNTEHWLYHEGDNKRYFLERSLNTELSEKDVTKEKLEHKWSEWEVVKQATVDEEGLKERTCSVCKETESEVIPKLSEATYSNTEGANQTWTKGSNVNAQFIFKRDTDDELTFSHFSGILIDGNEIDESKYYKEEGSVIVKLKPAFLETLSVGKHTLTAMFDDGIDPTVNFIVAEKGVVPPYIPPKTGD